MPKSIYIKIIALLFFGLYGIGTFFPDNWWGTHYMAFLPVGIKYAILIMAILLITVPYKIQLRKIKLVENQFNLGIILTGAIMGVLFYFFPIIGDIYGDAYRYAPMKDTIPKVLPNNFYQDLFSLNPLPSTGRKTVLLFYGFLSYAFNVSYYTIFKWVGVVCGILYTWTWLFFVKWYLTNTHWKILLMIVGLIAPIMQFFYGHVETYAVVFLFLQWWLLLWLIYIRTKNTKYLWLLLPLLFINLKIHPLSILLIIVWGISVCTHYCSKSVISRKLLSWKGISLIVLAPIFIASAYLYFFVLKDYNDPRFVEGAKDIDRLFLPLISPEPPLDRYNLLSFNHIFDYFMTSFQWSSCAWFIIAFLVLFHRKKINWNNEDFRLFTTLFILVISLLFMINPLLSMPMDWDLFSYPTAILLIIALLLIKQVEHEKIPLKVFSCTIALGICSVPMFMVNANKEAISYRLESTNIHVYKTYYQHSAYNMLYALSLLNDDIETYVKRKERLLNELEPYAIKGNDIKYANLLMDQAVYYYETKDFKLARYYAHEGFSYSPLLHENTKLLLQSNYQLKHFNEAYENAMHLLEYKFPDEKLAFKVAMQMALENNSLDNAKHLVNMFLNKYPEDTFVLKIDNGLKSGANPHQIKQLFYD